MNALAQNLSGAAPIVLRAEDVGVTFDGADRPVEAIRKVDFELRRGETLAIVGPSGCGKSTLFNAIAGLLRPTRGHVEVGGRRVDDAAGHVGYMLQKDLLLPWRSVLDNVMLGLEIRKTPKPRAREIALELIRTYGLSGFEHAKPAALSGGMRQRVAIMRTLAFDPDVILLDEPFSALDFQTRLLMQADVSRIIAERGKSAILVTHDIGEAIAMADRVLVLSARPATVRALHVIELPRDGRDPAALRTDPQFQDYFAKIWADLEKPASVA
ncbi:spermidine/putrescine ABC transporter ATP-binding protein [Bradyrhizobium sacchari]|uniref:NitT/TauT family transport system ATP-binding protein n=1 Tax=Bradyrhizobium sacchari TaxID=1399419 RepID=A0A560J583_9BRAD|nr:ABC transporter ATP-binding protein [Bradyrhizobium sacchari]OPY96949.1 spermidine/putrescine ABC transporter ATP-binding protein [Bradyrhizobium sacchari]TWB47719.1 NitT/TauT family transport system ATP-binding protein [Bradyrhizobium sacchari]TWB66187.1 NitT/TauT family transport system ATP-binding protein [Bradyrhizobium sacchari]